MAQPATISREQAAKQQAELQPQPPPEAKEPPKSAAPGSHPARPIESDPEALAAYQGRDRIEARQATDGEWHLNAFHQPVFRATKTAGGARRSARNLSEPEEPVLPPGQRGEDLAAQPGERPAERRKEK